MATPNIQLIAETAVSKHAAEKNAHGVVGTIMGQNHGHTGGADGQRIQHSALLGFLGDGQYHLSADQFDDLTDGGESALHYHASDRDRATHTGTQDAATVTGIFPWSQIDPTGSNLNEITTRIHNDLQDMDGGGAASFAQSGLFQANAVQPETTFYFHVSTDDSNELTRGKTVAETAIDLSLDDTIGTASVTAPGKTVTLPKGTAQRIGKEWTVVLSANGYTDVSTTGGDLIMLPTSDTTIRLNTKGSSVTLRCLNSSLWGIV